jgi:hypothetical protein
VDRFDDQAEELLARPPRPPADLGRFTSNDLPGEPGIYPDGPPMAPAAGPPPADDEIEEELLRLAPDARERFRDPVLRERAPDAGVRAALALLGETIGATALEVFERGGGLVETLRYGKTATPGAAVGPPYQPRAAGERCVSTRYRAEHFALVAPWVVRDLLWSGPGAGHAEDATLHALVALTHVQLVARHPDLGEQRTELARRLHSLALRLLSSRRPGSARIELVAPDGPGTVPGGAPARQTPDFWSLPFGARAEDGTRVEDGARVPPAVARTLAALAAPEQIAPPDRYTDEVGVWISAHLGRQVLPVRSQLAAAVALGLLAPTGD